MYSKLNLKNQIDALMANDDVRHGILSKCLPEFKLQGDVWLSHKRGNILLLDNEYQGHNTFTTEGMAYLLNLVFHNSSKAAADIWYVFLFKASSVTPALADTAATKLGAAGTYQECQDADYDSPITNRPSYTLATTTTASITNSAARAEFVIASGITVYGAGLTDTAPKTDTSGHLMCAKKFTSARPVVADDELLITYQISCTTS